MKEIFSKIDFPKAPDGDIYEWKDAETDFDVSEEGFFVIKIAAKAKNAKQNQSTDDDDLRIVLDGFSFGKYEKHQSEISWKGFGTSSAWSGASLKGGTKINYYFLSLSKGSHKIQFFADKTPEIKSLEVFELKDQSFKLENVKPTEQIDTDKNGIPWLSLIFLGAHPKHFLLDVKTKSAKEKGSTDADNLKVVLNGKILENKVTSSDKYKNFYFSGDTNSIGLLALGNQELLGDLAFENSLELWYDQEPEISKIEINFFDNEEFLKKLKSTVDLQDYYFYFVGLIIIIFKVAQKKYSAKFLKHSLNKNSQTLNFQSNHPIVKIIKKDPSYQKILEKVKEKVEQGILNGEIWPEDFKNDPQLNGNLSLNSYDLATAIHGIKKIEYQSQLKKNNTFEVYLTVFDVYDFQGKDLPKFLSEKIAYIKTFILNNVDMAEELEIIHPFEIVIKIKENL